MPRGGGLPYEAVVSNLLIPLTRFPPRFLGWLKQAEAEHPRDRYDMRCFFEADLGDDFET